MYCYRTPQCSHTLLLLFCMSGFVTRTRVQAATGSLCVWPSVKVAVLLHLKAPLRAEPWFPSMWASQPFDMTNEAPCTSRLQQAASPRAADKSCCRPLPLGELVQTPPPLSFVCRHITFVLSLFWFRIYIFIDTLLTSILFILLISAFPSLFLFLCLCNYLSSPHFCLSFPLSSYFDPMFFCIFTFILYFICSVFLWTPSSCFFSLFTFRSFIFMYFSHISFLVSFSRTRMST
jgi:hypothetical protein